MLHAGEHNGYFWLVEPTGLRSLPTLVKEFHRGMYLGIISFDGGAIRPDDAEIHIGWTTQGKVMVSPPLTDDLDLPRSQSDEWCIVAEPSFGDAEFETFALYGGFTLVPPKEIYETFDPTWDRHGLDFLAPIQERFWHQVARTRSVTYVSMGWNDVIVSRNREFIEQVRNAANV